MSARSDKKLTRRALLRLVSRMLDCYMRDVRAERPEDRADGVLGTGEAARWHGEGIAYLCEHWKALGFQPRVQPQLP